MPSRRPDEPVPEVAPLARALHELDESHRRFRQHLAHTLALSTTELTALLVIADTPMASPKALAGEVGISSGAVTALLDRLERAGLTSRIADPTDRRRLTITLTATGNTTLQRIQVTYRSILRHENIAPTLTDVLPELATLSTALNTAATLHHPF